MSIDLQSEQTVDKTAILNGMDWGSAAIEHGDLLTGIFRTDRGLVLRCRRPNSNLVQKAVQQFKVPDVPEVMDTEREVLVENPDDPDYVAAVQKYEADVLLLVNDIYMAHADIVDMPEDMQRPEDTEWAKDAEFFGIQVPEKGVARFVTWLNSYAMDDDEYKSYLAFTMFYNSRVKEADIRAKIDSFRNTPEGAEPVRVPNQDES